MGLVMALTESGMITLLKDLNWQDPAKSVWVVNTSASVWFGLALIVQGLLTGSDRADILESGTWWDAAVLTAFHSVTMFSGYWLRYYAIPRLSTVSFAILSYAGLLASYMFGLVIVGERPGWMSVVGAAIIVGSGLALRFVK
jgi:drug/metabolite transporter (DMT)-like permease